MKILILLIFTLIGCENKSASPIFRSDVEAESRRLEEARIEREEQRVEELNIQKQKDWVKIVSDANESYQEIKPIIYKKCFDCHDERAKLPIYGRIFRRYNPVFHHLRDGLRAIDFSQEFPLRASKRFGKSELEPEVKV